MGILRYEYYSETLHTTKEITLVGPMEDKEELKNSEILLLLHGLGGYGKDFLHKTSLLMIANKYNLIVILCDCDRSFYTNMSNGYNYFDYITKEVPEVVNNLLNKDVVNTNKYIAGSSMGGYGALKIGAMYPEKFLGIGSISGSVDIVSRGKIKRQEDNFIKGEWENIFGENLENENDLFKLVENLQDKNKKIYICCGDKDHLIEYNDKFNHHLTNLNIRHTYVKNQGEHNWEYFSKMLEETIKNILDR